MAKDIRQTTVRLPEDLADDAETVARVKGTSVIALIIDALNAESERVRQDGGLHQPSQAAARTRPETVGASRPVTRDVTLAEYVWLAEPSPASAPTPWPRPHDPAHEMTALRAASVAAQAAQT